jgi:preprotein translocase subunit SecE
MIIDRGFSGGALVAFLGKIRQGFGSTFSFFSDSWIELKKVKWPTRKEVVSYTIVVLVTVAFVTIYFSLLDLGISEVLRLIFE